MDETKRQTILRLLADEEAKLASLDNPPQRDGPPQLGLGYPFPPVRGLHINPLLGLSLLPTRPEGGGMGRQAHEDRLHR